MILLTYALFSRAFFVFIGRYFMKNSNYIVGLYINLGHQFYFNIWIKTYNLFLSRGSRGFSLYT